MEEQIIEKNKKYWDDHADLWFGTTALPKYGVKFATEDDLHFFSEVEGKKVLEICCGSGHSLKYLADKGAEELWGLDLSQKQLDNAGKLLKESGCNPKLICAPMEADSDIPQDYFDYVYSIYGIGWTTDLEGTFKKAASYLKSGGYFIFSWGHPLHYCVAKSYETGEDVVMNNKFKLMALLLCFAATAMMVSCTPEKEEETNPLVGTKWACKYSNSNMVIEFVSAKEVQAYFANSALAYERGLTSGSYTVSGSNVTFNNLDLVWEVLSSRSHYKPQKGTFSGSIMQTQGQQSIYSDNDWMTWNETWNKQ